MFVEIIFRITPCSHFRLPNSSLGKSIECISTFPVPTYATPRLLAIMISVLQILRFTRCEVRALADPNYSRQYTLVSQEYCRWSWAAQSVRDSRSAPGCATDTNWLLSGTAAMVRRECRFPQASAFLPSRTLFGSRCE